MNLFTSRFLQRQEPQRGRRGSEGPQGDRSHPGEVPLAVPGQ